MSLVSMLATSAMQQLGKLAHPATGKCEISLEGAQFTVDLLEMLRAKTAGNLDRDEKRLLDDTLASLQLNYVETAQAAPAAKQAPQEPGAPAPEPQPPASGEEGPPGPDSGQPPRFRKSYG
jgi:hypothetical protein